MLRSLVGSEMCIRDRCYTESPPQAFEVRSATYLKKKKKYKPTEAMFTLVGVDTFKVDRCQAQPAEWEGSVYQIARRNAEHAGEQMPRWLVVNFMCPGDPDINLVLYFAEKPFEPKTESDHEYKRLVDHFFDCDDHKFQKKRFKLIPLCVKGGWLVKKAMGTPALIAKKLETNFRRTTGYLEVSVDVGSSSVAKRVLGTVSGALTSLVLDLGFTIEGKMENELPERLVGGCRIQYVDLEQIPEI
eukprot:TRINITY_DN2842_c0_g1_i10.p1 TRINITY_DN2842_c0_g1~~TRINITY_DN2842_c0_g1_i10.p1  ORF type:complete len:244 (+),score=58.80 TRINITY_DN2842_c0_g1_i10:107-838(+)